MDPPTMGWFRKQTSIEAMQKIEAMVREQILSNHKISLRFMVVAPIAKYIVCYSNAQVVTVFNVYGTTFC